MYASASVSDTKILICDKPLLISHGNQETFDSTIEAATRNGVFLQELLTERFELGIIIQAMMVANEGILGELQDGSAADPAAVLETGHNLEKRDKNIVRPEVYFKPETQGYAFCDVGCHNTDTLLLMLQNLNLLGDLELQDANIWDTNISTAAMCYITGGAYHYNKPAVDYPCNGSFTFRSGDKYAKITTVWDIHDERGDWYHSVINGTKCTIETTLNGKEKTITVTANSDADIEGMESSISGVMDRVHSINQEGCDKLEYSKDGKRFTINIPSGTGESHEDHFANVVYTGLSQVAGNETVPISVASLQGNAPGQELELTLSKLKYGTHMEALANAMPRYLEMKQHTGR